MNASSTPEHPYAAFAHRDFRMFYMARLANNFGTNIMMPTLGWQIYALTRNPLALGLIGMSTFIPVVLTTLPSGHIADRFERRRTYGWSQVLLVVTALIFLALTLAHVTVPLWFYACASLFGVAKTLSMPTATAWMPHLVPRRHFPVAVAWTSSAFQISNVLGPALVGLTLYVWGEASTYGMAAGCYFLSLVFGMMVHTRSRGAATQASGTAGLFGGLAYVWRSRLIFGATTLDLFALLLGGATAMLPVYAFEVLHVGEGGFGILRSAPALGSTVTGLVLAHRPLRSKVGTWMFLSVFVYGVAIMTFGASRFFPLSVAALVLLGASETVGAFVRQTLVQLSTHDDMRGRVTSVNMMFVSARNELGDVEAGFVASLIGVVPAVVLGGAGAIVIGGLWAWLFPALRTVDRFSDAMPDSPGAPPAAALPRPETIAALATEEVLEARN